LDRRLLIGILLTIVLGVAAFAFLSNPPGPGDGENGGNGGNGEIFVTINGTILDENTGTPLNSVTVSINGNTETTNEKGQYSIKLENGTYTVTVEKSEYQSESLEVEAKENETYTLDFALTPEPAGPRILKIITRHGSDILDQAERHFLESDYAEEYNIQDIRWLPVGPSLWADTIRASGDVDIGWGGGPVLFDVIKNENLLAPLTQQELVAIMDILPDEISGVPTKRIEDGDIYWVGSAIASFGFTINKEYLQTENLPRPNEWADLANESYAITLPQPSVGTADATQSTSNTRMFEIILQGYDWREGWNLLTLKGANSRIYDQSGLVRDAVIQGTISVGTNIDFYGYTAQLQAPEICEYILPEDGTIVNADPIALLTTSQSSEAAQAFITWILSAEGQKIWLDPNINRLPMNPAVFETPEGEERQDLENIYLQTQQALIIDFSDELALSYENSLMWFYHFTVVRPQIFLTDAWMDITQAKFDESITEKEFQELAFKLGDPHEIEFVDPETGNVEIFTLEYAQDINTRIRESASFRDQLGEVWMDAAEERYNLIQEELEDLTS
jgi:ABC-type Fe3+ transport system substrate-binding protein